MKSFIQLRNAFHHNDECADKDQYKQCDIKKFPELRVGSVDNPVQVSFPELISGNQLMFPFHLIIVYHNEVNHFHVELYEPAGINF